MSFLDQPITLQTLFGPKRQIGPINVQVVVNETASDTLKVTKQPVQQGASITDHAFKEPTVFSTTILFKDNLFTSLSKIYQDLLDLQNLRTPFDIITPKRIYSSMLLVGLGQTTDKTTENCLSISATFQEIIIVPVVTTTVPRAKQKIVAVTQATQDAGKKSGLFVLKEGVVAH